jgi:hypothetical protein
LGKRKTQGATQALGQKKDTGSYPGTWAKRSRYQLIWSDGSGLTKERHRELPRHLGKRKTQEATQALGQKKDTGSYPGTWAKERYRGLPRHLGKEI